MLGGGRKYSSWATVVGAKAISTIQSSVPIRPAWMMTAKVLRASPTEVVNEGHGGLLAFEAWREKRDLTRTLKGEEMERNECSKVSRISSTVLLTQAVAGDVFCSCSGDGQGGNRESEAFWTGVYE